MAVSTKVRVGVAGAGVMGERHARVYSELPDTQLVGVYDIDASKSIEAVRRHGGYAFSSFEDLLRSVDALTIASPTVAHADMAVAAIDAGVHLLIEKPLAATLDEAERIRSRTPGNRTQVAMVGHIERFNPAVIALRNFLEGKQISSLTARRMGPFGNRALDTDVVHDLMIHDVDLILDLFGDEIESIDAIGTPVRTKFVDQAMAQITMTDGIRIDLIASRVANRKVQALEVRIDGATVLADLREKQIDVRHDSPGITGHPNGRVEHIPVGSDEPLKLELQHFIDCINGRDRLSSDVEAGYRALAYVETILDLVGRGAGSATAPVPAHSQGG